MLRWFGYDAETRQPVDPENYAAYRSGDRDHPLMSSQAKDLTDQQIADLAAYFGSRKSNLRDLHGAHN